MGNTQTQEEYLVKQKKLFKKALLKKDYEQARSHLLRIDNLEMASPRGNIRPYIPVVAEVKLPNRKERRAAMRENQAKLDVKIPKMEEVKEDVSEVTVAV
jgi:ATP-dependent Lon protease